ncbi:MAG: glycosyltransferase [Cryomorphaceae bacterium]|nr:glycosyltransferase [Cryomorphaceae bacterium]
MNILVLTYWSYKEPLVHAATIGYIKEIRKYIGVEGQIYLLTMEKEALQLSSTERQTADKMLAEHGIELITKKYHYFGFQAALAWIKNLLWLTIFCRKKKIDIIHARGSTAGLTAHILSRLTKKKFVVDGFEPHADSMVENGTWKKGSLSFRILHWSEKQQARNAAAVLAMTENMADYSAEAYGYIPGNFFVRPGCVDLSVFNEHVSDIRASLGLTGKLVCVYAGKLGGIYLKEEVFAFYSACYERFGDQFRALLLSDHSDSEVELLAKNHHLPAGLVIHKHVLHSDVPKYLASADFALNPVKPVPSKKYCTSIKDGEYWAMGLPVVITPNISSDSDLIEREEIGVIWDGYDRDTMQSVLDRLETVLSKDRSALQAKIRRIALERRDLKIASENYRLLYGENGLLQKESKQFLALIYNSLRDPLFQNLVYSYLDKQLEEHPNYRLNLVTFEQDKYAFTPEEQQRHKIHLTSKRIYWRPVKYHSGNFKLIKKVLDLTNAFLTATKIILRKRQNLVVSFANTSAVISHFVAQFFRTPLLIYSYEPHSDFLKEFGIWSTNSITYQIMHRLEWRVGRKAAYVLTGTRHMVEALKGKTKGLVFRAPSSADDRVFYFDNLARQEIREKYNLKNRKVIVYVGKFGGIYYRSEIIGFFAALRALDPAYFLFIVSPQDHQELTTMCGEGGLNTEDYCITETASQAEIRGFNSAADIGLTAVPPYPSQRFRSPVKVGEYLMCGLPYITMRGVSEDDEVAEKNNVGIVLSALDAAQADEAHDKMRELFQEDTHALRKRCRDVGIEYRGKHHVDQLFDRLLSEV